MDDRHDSNEANAENPAKMIEAEQIEAQDEAQPEDPTQGSEPSEPAATESTPRASEERPPDIIRTLPPPPPPPALGAAPMPPRPRSEKSPALAVFLAIVLGLGHFYIGVYQRAAAIIITFFLSIYLLPMPLEVFAPIFIWFFSLFDAYRQAQLANLARDERRKSAESPQWTLMFGVFLTVVGAILLIDQFFPIDLEFLRRWWPLLLIGGGIWAIIGALREQKSTPEDTSQAATDEPASGQ